MEGDVSVFDRLPDEIIAEIFDVIYESYSCEYEAPAILNRERFLDQRIMAPLQLSSRLRAIALAHVPLWRSIATIAASSCTLRELPQTSRLLMLCSERSKQTLDIIDLEALAIHPDSCPYDILDLLKAVTPSAASLRDLRLPPLPAPDNDWGYTCDCHLCFNDRKHSDPTSSGEREDPSFDEESDHRLFDEEQDDHLSDDEQEHLPSNGDQERLPVGGQEDDLSLYSGHDNLSFGEEEQEESMSDTTDALGIVEQIGAAMVKLLLTTSRLQHLTLNLSSVVLPVLPDQAPTSLARLESLQLCLPTDDDSGSEFIEILSQMGINLKEIYIEWSVQAGWERTPNPAIACTMIRTAASKLYVLKVSGPSIALSLSNWVQSASQFSLLRVLWIGQWDEETGQSDAWTSLLHLPLLTSYEGPSQLLGSLHMPNLLSLAIRLKSGDDNLLLAKLQQCTQLKDCVVQFHQDTVSSSEMIGRVLRSLLPSKITETLCPFLERLRLFGWGTVSWCDWLTDIAFEDPKRSVGRLNARTFIPQGWYSAPMIGLDLPHLARRRNEGHSQPLKAIELINCLVDPAAWTSLITESSCEHLVCDPDPFEVRRTLARLNAGMLQSVNKAMDRLNVTAGLEANETEQTSIEQ